MALKLSMLVCFLISIFYRSETIYRMTIHRGILLTARYNGCPLTILMTRYDWVLLTILMPRYDWVLLTILAILFQQIISPLPAKPKGTIVLGSVCVSVRPSH